MLEISIHENTGEYELLVYDTKRGQYLDMFYKFNENLNDMKMELYDLIEFFHFRRMEYKIIEIV